MQPSLTAERTISRPFSKLNRLCAEAKARGGMMTTFAAVAKAIELTPGRVTQLFGHGQEAEGVVVKAATVWALVGAFKRDGVPCEIDWLYLQLDEFTLRLASAAPTGVAESVAADWELREHTVLPDLVELRLHPPRPGNEVEDSFYVETTLLFGTAECDVEPEADEEPRTVAIALRDARLAMGSASYRVVADSMIGERVKSEHFRRVAGGIDISGPTNNEGTLDGDPIGNQHLAVIVPTNIGDDPFAVAVAAGRRSFVVTDVSEGSVGGAPADNKTVILNQLIYRRCGKDEAGRTVLAEATMKRRPEPGDPTA